MGIQKENRVVARCDAKECKAVRFGTDDQPPVGYSGEITMVAEIGDDVVGITIHVFGCSLAHYKKAALEMFEDGQGSQVIYTEERQGSGEQPSLKDVSA